MIDLSQLATPEGKEIYYYEALQSGLLLESLVEHFDASRQAMVESGFFDETEAAATAASVACGALAGTIKNLRDSRNTTILDRVDRFVRTVHGIRPSIFPHDHEDPLVAAFYTNLEPYLLKAQAGDRTGPWDASL